jgi:hypothetical protein
MATNLLLLIQCSSKTQVGEFSFPVSLRSECRSVNEVTDSLFSVPLRHPASMHQKQQKKEQFCYHTYALDSNPELPKHSTT